MFFCDSPFFFFFAFGVKTSRRVSRDTLRRGEWGVMKNKYATAQGLGRLAFAPAFSC